MKYERRRRARFTLSRMLRRLTVRSIRVEESVLLVMYSVSVFTVTR
jgi:hypothetical protein